MKKIILAIVFAFGMGSVNTYAKDMVVLGDMVLEVVGQGRLVVRCLTSEACCMKITSSNIATECKVDLYQDDVIVESFYADENFRMEQEGEETVLTFETVEN